MNILMQYYDRKMKHDLDELEREDNEEMEAGDVDSERAEGDSRQSGSAQVSDGVVVSGDSADNLSSFFDDWLASADLVSLGWDGSDGTLL